LRFFLLGFDDMELVTEAESGEEALGLCAEVQPDVILMDMVMPGMNGLDVCRTLKRDIKTRSIPIIIFSALGNGLDMMLENRDKADAYITKPFTSKVLLDKISELLF